MVYEVFMHYGEKSTAASRVEGVDELGFYDESYYFYDTVGKVLFVVPSRNVIYIEKK